MGVAAYSRGSRALSRRIDEELSMKRVMKSETRERRIARDREEMETMVTYEGPHSFWADMLAAHIDHHGKDLP